MRETAINGRRTPEIATLGPGARRVPASTAEHLLPDGVWTVDPHASEIGFAAKGFWGLQTVRGVFRTYHGMLSVVDGEVEGHLAIEAGSLDTGQTRRDRHLRSADFFRVERYPRVVFTTIAVGASERGLIVAGRLTVGPAQVELEIPVEVDRDPDGALRVRGEANVSREAVGMIWNWLGSIRGDAELHARLLLAPAG
jgi:polyisoprenoid-binding protein YceI